MPVDDLAGAVWTSTATTSEGTSEFSACLTASPAVPAAPSAVSATGGVGQATVSWTAPADDGGTPIVGYVVTPYIGITPLNSRIFVSTATTQVIHGLDPATTYRFKVAAFNTVGAGAASRPSNPTTTATTPGPPTIGAATAGPGQATISWTPPVGDGGTPIVGYVVTAYIGFTPVKNRIYLSTATTQTITGLTPGTTYRFKVAAFNTIGAGTASRPTSPTTPT